MCKLSREAQERMHREAQAVAKGGEEPVGETATNVVLDLRRTDSSVKHPFSHSGTVSTVIHSEVQCLQVQIILFV